MRITWSLTLWKKDWSNVWFVLGKEDIDHPCRWGYPTFTATRLKCNCSSIYCIIKFASSLWEECRGESRQNTVIQLLQLMVMDNIYIFLRFKNSVLNWTINGHMKFVWKLGFVFFFNTMNYHSTLPVLFCTILSFQQYGLSFHSISIHWILLPQIFRLFLVSLFMLKLLELLENHGKDTDLCSTILFKSSMRP